MSRTVFEGRIDVSDVHEMHFSEAEAETYLLRRGDILLNEGQSPELVGRPAMFNDEIAGACFQNTLLRFRAGPAVDRDFALIVFRHYLHAGEFKKVAQWSTNIAHLTKTRFSTLSFPVPPMAEQQRIVAEADDRTVVRKIWGGRANMAEFKGVTPSGPLELIALRVYNPTTRQWSLNFATSGVGKLGDVPGVGDFKDGRIDFYDQEPINGRAILVRFSVYATGPTTHVSEQAYSADGGKTWEVNWINRYTLESRNTEPPEDLHP